jgi:hypothetical protein
MKLLGVLTALAVALYLGVTLAFPSYAHRYRLTIEIETPDGVRSGSSVIEVTRRDVTWILIAQGRHEFDVRGEAPFVDLGANRHVIAIMAHGPRAENVSQMISLPIEAYGYYKWDEAAWSHHAKMKGPVELTPPLIPTLVTFSDSADPKSAKVVYGVHVTRSRRTPRVEVVDRLTEQFGPGVRFKRGLLETTTEPLSSHIEAKLPEIIRQLREQARAFRTWPADAPYTAQLGQFIRS